MQIVKQLNPINTTIYIEFDMIIDVDFGLLRYVGLEFADDRIFYTEIFENDDKYPENTENSNIINLEHGLFPIN